MDNTFTVIQRNIRLDFQHRTFFTHGAFDAANPVLKDILKEAHNNLKGYNSDLSEAHNIVEILEKNDGLTEEEVENALLELELINESIKSYYAQNANLKNKLQLLKGGKHKKYKNQRKTIKKKRNGKKKH